MLPRPIVALSLVALISAVSYGADRELRLENTYLSRTISIADKRVATTKIVNKLAKRELITSAGGEFRLRLSHNVDSREPDVLLTAADFEVVESEGKAEAIRVELRNATHGLNVTVHYTLATDRSFGHKQLDITADRPWVLELVDIESLACADAYEPYKAKDMMHVTGRFLPALGQPLYASHSATFWGVEFPASWNRVEEKAIHCGVQYGVELKPGEKFTTHRAVFGVADDPEFIQDAFLEYIDQLRATPVKLSVQYNSWFDFGGGVSQAKLLESLATLNRELVEKRGCRPLDVFVIDDGWQNSRPPRSPLADWSKGLYPVNEATFGPNLEEVRKAIEAKGSKMGLWASPACIFGATANIDVLDKNGFEVLVGGKNAKSGTVKKSMSLAGPKYLALLEKRLLEMVDMGSVYFKLDGIYGDLTCRYFETQPGRGVPVMASLLPEGGITANDERLDNPKFDEMKRYYLTTCTSRLAAIFDKMHAQNPAVRILCHNGATISPWWLMHVDVLSLVNSQDGAPGNRTEQMCYRDGLYYQMTRRDGLQVPLCSFFNHEPAKDGNRFADASPEAFRDYFFMALSRGTTTVELYFVVNSLKPEDYDVVAAGLKWLYRAAPAFKRARLHGGSPIGKLPVDKGQLSIKKFNADQEGEVYGYTGWTETQGYVSIHNPSASAKSYSFPLDRRFGLLPNSGPFNVVVAHARRDLDLKDRWNYGDTVTLELKPREVIVLDFNRIDPQPVPQTKAGAEAGKPRRLRAKDVFDYRTPIIFQDDFSSASLARWKISQDDQYDLAQNDPQRLDIVAAEGLGLKRKAARFTVERGPDIFRSEIALPHEEGFQERWYAARVLVPKEWVIDKTPGDDIVLQWHAIPGNWRATYPNLAISIQDERWFIRQSYGAAQTKPTRTSFELKEKVVPGTRVSWVVHAKWSPNDEGGLQVWQDDRLVWERSGPNVYGTIGVEYTPYLKTGIYHPEWHLTSDEKRAAFEAEKPSATKKVILVTDLKVGSERATFKDVAPDGAAKETPQGTADKP